MLETRFVLRDREAIGGGQRRRQKPPSTGMIFRNDAPTRRCREASHENVSCLARFEWNGNPLLTFIGFAIVHRVRVFPFVQTTLGSICTIRYNSGDTRGV